MQVFLALLVRYTDTRHNDRNRVTSRASHTNSSLFTCYSRRESQITTLKLMSCLLGCVRNSPCDSAKSSNGLRIKLY